MKDKKKNLILVGILMGVSMYTLMQTIVATVLPIAAREMGESNLYGWVFSGYLLMSTVTIPIFSKLADLYGYKRFFLIGMGAFLSGTLLCALSDSFEMLVIARLLQGIGAGVLGPVAMALISNLYPAEVRGTVFALFAVVQLMSNLLGPVLGGMIADAFGWSAAFWFVLPLGIFSLIVLMFGSIPQPQSENTSNRIDYIGALLLGCAIALFVQTWSVFETDGWTIAVSALLAGTAVFMLLFLIVEKQQSDPVISPELLKIANVSLSSLCALLSGILNYGTIMLLPILAASIFQGGTSYLLLVPLMLGVSTGMVISGKLSATKPYRVLVRTAWTLCAISLTGMTILCYALVWMKLFFLLALLLGGGLGILMPSILLPAQNAVSDSLQATVSGMIQLSRNVGGAVGIPIITGILALSKGNMGYGLAFLFLTILCLIGLLTSSRFQGSATDI